MSRTDNDWKIIQCPVDDMDAWMLKEAKILGKPIGGRNSKRVIEELRPKSSKEAYKSSLSCKYSKGEFPLHTDTAHWPLPCRFMLLGCINPGISSRTTRILKFSDIELTKHEKELFYSTPFLFKNGRNSFYGKVMEPNRGFVRFDPGCMTPVSDDGRRIMDIMLSKKVTEKAYDLSWQKGNILILNNWITLHGRGSSPEDDQDRMLKRVLVA